MIFWFGSVGVATAVLSAIALYACSPHCPWSLQRQQPRAMRIAGVVLAVLSLAAWTCIAGFAVGLCTMLACWMLSLILLPYLALLGAQRGTPLLADVDVG